MSNTARDGVITGSFIAAGPVGATGPSNTTVPSDDRAVRTRRDTIRRTRSPGPRTAGSHTNVTRVSPPSPRAIPTHGRINVLTWRGGAGGAVRPDSVASLG